MNDFKIVGDGKYRKYKFLTQKDSINLNKIERKKDYIRVFQVAITFCLIFLRICINTKYTLISIIEYSNILCFLSLIAVLVNFKIKILNSIVSSLFPIILILFFFNDIPSILLYSKFTKYDGSESNIYDYLSLHLITMIVCIIILIKFRENMFNLKTFLSGVLISIAYMVFIDPKIVHTFEYGLFALINIIIVIIFWILIIIFQLSNIERNKFIVFLEKRRFFFTVLVLSILLVLTTIVIFAYDIINLDVNAEPFFTNILVVGICVIIIASIFMLFKFEKYECLVVYISGFSVFVYDLLIEPFGWYYNFWFLTIYEVTLFGIIVIALYSALTIYCCYSLVGIILIYISRLKDKKVKRIALIFLYIVLSVGGVLVDTLGAGYIILYITSLVWFIGNAIYFLCFLCLNKYFQNKQKWFSYPF